MSTSPKRVQINLIKQSNRKKSSPQKRITPLKQEDIKQFSFSDDLPSTQMIIKQSNSPTFPTPLAKKLFNNSPNIKKRQQIYNNSTKQPKQKFNKILQKYRKMNPNYQQYDEQSKHYKKSLETLKKSIFKTDGNSKQTTKKILREIGKYAQNRQKSKQKKSLSKQRSFQNKARNIPVQFYGFKNNDPQQRKPIKLKRQSLEKGTYLNFERAYDLTISNNNQQFHNIDYKNNNIEYHLRSKQKSRHRTTSNYQYQQFKQYQQQPQIGQRQIDTVCSIFQLCHKYEEGDKIDRQDLRQLTQSLKRRYQILIAQQSLNQYSNFMPDVRFQGVLQQFQQDLRVIFYRKAEHDIYDTLYYLRQTNHLDLVCQDFYKLRRILNI